MATPPTGIDVTAPTTVMVEIDVVINHLSVDRKSFPAMILRIHLTPVKVRYWSRLRRTSGMPCKPNKLVMIRCLETLDTRALYHLQESARSGTLSRRWGGETGTVRVADPLELF